MKIPFIRITKPNIETFNALFSKSIEQNHYSNFGPNEKMLTSILERDIGYPIVCAANATLILEGLHDILGKLCSMAYLSGFTFPSTNLGCRIRYCFGETETQGSLIGFSRFEPKGGATDYAITTAPFGTLKPKNYQRPDTTFWIVDNAAGASPKMEKVKDWLLAGADAVVCSLHATKIMSGCEGGFVAFNHRFLYEFYKKYIVFGFYLDEKGQKQAEKYGSNHKMSELSAAFAMMFYKDLFETEYNGRMSLMEAYQHFCQEHDMQFIASPQAFWVRCNTEAAEVEKRFAARDVETKPYYRPLWNEDGVDAGSLTLSRVGLCLPTWNMSADEKQYVLDNLDVLT
jgi:hypothetical protein